MSLSAPARVARRRLLLGAAIATVAVADAAVSVALAPPGPTTPVTAQVTYAATKRRVIPRGRSVWLHSMRYSSPGGVVTVRWYDSDIEPMSPGTFAVVSLYVDGRAVASLVKGSYAGTFDDRPGLLTWSGRLTPGEHQVNVRLTSERGGWGIPYTDAPELGVDQLSVEADSGDDG